jgi:AP-1 complex subunit beta-1
MMWQQVAKSVILAEKPTIADDTFALEPSLLDSLIGQIATLASIYHKPPEAFVVRSSIPVGQVSSPRGDDDDYELDFLDSGDGATSPTQAPAPAPRGGAPPARGGDVDLLDIGDLGPAPAPAPMPAPAPAPGPSLGGGLDDLLGGGPPAPAPAPTMASATSAKPLVCRADQSQGIEIRAVLTNRGGVVVLEMDFRNLAAVPLQALAIKFNVNTFGLTPVDANIVFPQPIPLNGTGSFSVPLALTPQLVAQGQPPTLTLQTAVKNMTTQGVFYFPLPINLEALFAATGQVSRDQFIPAWKSIDDSLEVSSMVTDLPSANVDAHIQKLTSKNVVLIARRASGPGQETVYFAAVTQPLPQGTVHFLVELTFRQGVNAAKVAIKTQAQPLAPLCGATVAAILRA